MQDTRIDANPAAASSPATIVVEHRTGYSRFQVTGDSGSAPVLRDYWRRIVDTATERGDTRLLVVEDLPTSGFGATIEAVACVVASGGSRFRIAFVDLREGAQSFAEFGAMMARHRGMDARVFRTEAEAERWLTLGLG
jgi:hypothetical protein